MDFDCQVAVSVEDQVAVEFDYQVASRSKTRWSSVLIARGVNIEDQVAVDFDCQVAVSVEDQVAVKFDYQVASRLKTRWSSVLIARGRQY